MFNRICIHWPNIWNCKIKIIWKLGLHSTEAAYFINFETAHLSNSWTNQNKFVILAIGQTILLYFTTIFIHMDLLNIRFISDFFNVTVNNNFVATHYWKMPCDDLVVNKIVNYCVFGQNKFAIRSFKMQ